MLGSYCALVARFNGARASTRCRAASWSWSWSWGRVYPSTTWVKLKRQITVAGHVVVKEHKDDGHTRTLLDRPALNQLRADLKTDLFDAVHFLAADRIPWRTISARLSIRLSAAPQC
jgi:hypothetical protein